MSDMTNDVIVDVGPVAHGGHCVARHEGRVVFVRHALPGERVRAVLTDAAPDARFWRADAVEVLTASPDRVAHPWPQAGPGGVGGAELGHVALPAQRRWKEAVLAEQFRRLAHLDLAPEVVPAPDEHPRGLHWRTRIDLVADAEGRAGMHRHRSREVVPLAAMPLATAALDVETLLARRWPPGARISAIAPAGGDRPLVLVDGVPWRPGGPDRRPTARTAVRETVTVGDRTWRWRVNGAGFWQVHRSAPRVLVAEVLAAVGDVTGGRVFDLYAGAGLLTLPLAEAVGERGGVEAVEGDLRAVRDARRNLHDHPAARLHAGTVADVVPEIAGPRPDVVVLDPPRVGAGRAVVEAIVATGTPRVVYVACDPAALARDTGSFLAAGYRLAAVRGHDLFPLTHHVEAVAVIVKD